MNELLTQADEARGGIARRQELTERRATLVSGGDLFSVKGLPQEPAPREMSVRLHEEHASVTPFGAPDQRTDFTPGRVSIKKLDGRVVAVRENPRTSFSGHTLQSPWDPLDRAYFNGYALWTYLMDFSFGPDHLLRRHDHHVDVAGGFAAAQYVHDFVEADGILLPTRRRAYRRDADDRPLVHQVMVSIDLSDVRFR
ncbi:hypothetical protein ACWEQ2_15960 [Streptomyces sp. NPDC004096]|uniref:hypothetical protein n=1 Tax=unclassified Streptomyces TaxID=2593676 RepID=UPI00339F3337